MYQENKPKRGSRRVKHIFEPIEMELKDVEPDITADELLEQDGLFLLKPVAKKLGIDAGDLRKKTKAVNAAGRSSWEEIGIRKVLSVWFVRMSRFAPYFREEKSFKIQKVDPSWDGNQLLTKSGLFSLTDVCSKIPFTPHQFRHQVRNDPDARGKYGVWWDPDLRHYLVEMETFSNWITDLWLNRKTGF